ncbi:mPR-like GPCR protein [Hyaloscypha sp. PMI_1271]|nr:mPR-like GPCR protein [Hyaloscypha sp. PMI_1271]
MASELNLYSQRETIDQLMAHRPRQTRSQNNEFILTGYRPTSGSFQKSLSSLQHVYNEIVNIYSHLLGVILFVILLIYVYARARSHHAAIQISDIIGFVIFFFGVILCFSLSASFYIILNHSEKVANLYWAVVSVLAVVCTIVTLSPKFRYPTLRLYRTAMYASLGLSAIAFIIYRLIIHSWEIQNQRMSLTYMLITVMLNILAVVVYIIFHFIVVFAGLIYMFGLLSAFGFIYS